MPWNSRLLPATKAITVRRNGWRQVHRSPAQTSAFTFRFVAARAWRSPSSWKGRRMSSSETSETKWAQAAAKNGENLATVNSTLPAGWPSSPEAWLRASLPLSAAGSCSSGTRWRTPARSARR